MTISEAEQSFREFFESLPLTTLRIVGRKYGAAQSTAMGKDHLIDTLVDILMGKTPPKPRSKRGAPPKQTYIDTSIYDKIETIRNSIDPIPDYRSVAEKELAERKPLILEVNAPEPYYNIYEESVYTGILEITAGGYGFLRARNCQPSADGDVFIAAPVLHALKLREGDYVACTAKPRQKNDSAAIDVVLSVNGLPVGQYESRPYFDSLTAQYANEKIALSAGSGDVALRMLDLFAPIGKGQRALVIAPPKAGKTTILKAIARSIADNNRDICLIVLLIDERPEEVTDFRASVDRAEVISSTFDEGAEHHIRAAELTLEHAKRMAERGVDVVVLLDSITKLTRAYNNAMESTGKTLSGGLDAGAFAEPKRFFGAARNTVEAGSLTVIATALVDTGSRMDDVIYEEFKGTGNCDIFLSRELAERRVFPAIDIRRSGTRKEELLLSKEELAAVYKMRERGLTDNVAGLIEMLKKTQTNADFIARLPEWLKVYKNI